MSYLNYGGGYDYLDLLEERAFSEGYEARMMDEYLEQREFGFLDAIGRKTGLTSFKNSFNKARQSGEGVMGALKAAKARNSRDTVALAKNMREELGGLQNKVNATKSHITSTRRANSDLAMQRSTSTFDTIKGRNGKEYLTRDGDRLSNAEKDKWLKDSSYFNSRNRTRDYKDLTRSLKFAKSAQKLVNSERESAQKLISSVGKRGHMPNLGEITAEKVTIPEGISLRDKLGFKKNSFVEKKYKLPEL